MNEADRKANEARKNSPKQLKYERDTLWRCFRKYKKLVRDNSNARVPDMATLRRANGAIGRGSLYDLCIALNVDQGII